MNLITNQEVRNLLHALSMDCVETKDEFSWSIDTRINNTFLTISEDITEQHFCNVVKSIRDKSNSLEIETIEELNMFLNRELKNNGEAYYSTKTF